MNSETYTESLHNVTKINEQDLLALADLKEKTFVDLYGVVIKYREPKQTKGSGYSG